MKILAGVMFLALALGAVWEKVDVYRTGYAIEQLRIEKKQIQQEQRALELQLATVTSPEQIERVAVIEQNLFLPGYRDQGRPGAAGQAGQRALVFGVNHRLQWQLFGHRRRPIWLAKRAELYS